MEEQRKPSQLPPQLNVVLLPTTDGQQVLLAHETSRFSENFLQHGNADDQSQTKLPAEAKLNPVYSVFAQGFSANRFPDKELHDQLTNSSHKDLPRGAPFTFKIKTGSVQHTISGVPDAFKPYLERHLNQNALTYIPHAYRDTVFAFYFTETTANALFGTGPGQTRKTEVSILSPTHMQMTFSQKEFRNFNNSQAVAFPELESKFTLTLDLKIDGEMPLSDADIATLSDDSTEQERIRNAARVKVSLNSVGFTVFGDRDKKDKALSQMKKVIGFHQDILNVGFNRFIGKQNQPGPKVEQSTKIVDWLYGAVLPVEPRLVTNEKTKAAYQRLAPYQNSVPVKTKDKHGNTVTQTFFKKADGEIYSYTIESKENYFLALEKYLKAESPNPVVVACMDTLDALSTISGQVNRQIVIHFIEKAHENAFASTRLAIAALRKQANQPNFTQDKERALALLAELENQLTTIENNINQDTTPQELDEALQTIDVSELNTIFKNHVETVLGEKTVFELYMEKNPDAHPPKDDGDISKLLARGLNDKDLHVLIANLFVSGKLSLIDELPRLSRKNQTVLLMATLQKCLELSNFECFSGLDPLSATPAFFDAFASFDENSAVRLFDHLHASALKEIFQDKEPVTQNILAKMSARTNRPGMLSQRVKKDRYHALTTTTPALTVAKALQNNDADAIQRLEDLAYANKKMLLNSKAFIQWIAERPAAEQTVMTHAFLANLSVLGKSEINRLFSQIYSSTKDAALAAKILEFKKHASNIAAQEIRDTDAYKEFLAGNPRNLSTLGAQKLGELAAADISGVALGKLIESASQPKKTPWFWERWMQRFYVTSTIAENRLIATQEKALEKAISKLTDQFFAPAAYENLDQAHKQQLSTYIGSQNISTQNKLKRCLLQIDEKLEEAAKQKQAAAAPAEPTAVPADGTPPATSHYTGITGTLTDSALSSSPSPRESLFESGSPTASLKKVADSAKEIVPTPISPAKESFTPTSSQSAPTLGANGDPAAKKRLDFSNASLSIDDKGKDEATGFDNRKAVSAGGSGKLPKHGK